MAIDSVSAVDTAAAETADEAYITPNVDFLLLLISTVVIAFTGAAVIIP